MNRIKFARPHEIPLLEAAGYRCMGRSRRFPSFFILYLGEPPRDVDVIDDEEEHLIKAVFAMEGNAA